MAPFGLEFQMIHLYLLQQKSSLIEREFRLDGCKRVVHDATGVICVQPTSYSGLFVNLNNSIHTLYVETA